MFSKWIFLPEMYVLQAFPTLMLLCRFLVFSVCTNPCSMPLIHSTLSYFRHGYWRKRIKTRLQYHSYEITFCLLFFFSLDTEWAKVTVGVSVWKAKAVVPCPGWSCPSFHCVLPQATVPVVPQHLHEISCRKRIQAQNTHLWSGYFNPDQVLDWVHSTTPHAITPAGLRERCGTGEKQRDFGLQQAGLLPRETLIKLYQIFVLK